MRPLSFTILFFTLFAPACAVWNPDYVQDPDEALREILADAKEIESDDAVTTQRMQFAVEALATRHPNHVASQVAAATLAMDQGQHQRAQGYTDRALDLAPNNVVARCLKVRIAVRDGSLDLARKIVDDGLRMRPDAAALYESAAWIHQLDGRHDDALRALDAAAALEAPAWRICFHRGLVEEMRGHLDVAEKHYRAAWKANPSSREARQRLAGLRARRQLTPDR